MELTPAVPLVRIESNNCPSHREPDFGRNNSPPLTFMHQTSDFAFRNLEGSDSQ